MASERNQLIWGEIVARAWRDPDYKQRLLDNPKDVLIEAGSSVPDELEVKVVENTSTVRYIVLPESPNKIGESLSQKELDKVSGGGFEFTTTNTSIAAEAEITEAIVLETSVVTNVSTVVIPSVISSGS